jgi:hypothetical protein
MRAKTFVAYTSPILLKIYLKGRPSVQGPLFCHLDGKSLTRYQFVSILKKALNWACISDKGFSSHSFRIGAATSLAMEGVPVPQIHTPTSSVLKYIVFAAMKLLKIQYKLKKEKKKPFRISEIKICFISLNGYLRNNLKLFLRKIQRKLPNTIIVWWRILSSRLYMFSTNNKAMEKCRWANRLNALSTAKNRGRNAALL